MQKYKKQTLNSSKGEFERGVSEESLILSHLGRVDEKPSAIVPPLAITGAVLIPQSTSLANIATRKASKSFRGTANDIESEEESGEKQEGSPPKDHACKELEKDALGKGDGLWSLSRSKLHVATRSHSLGSTPLSLSGHSKNHAPSIAQLSGLSHPIVSGAIQQHTHSSLGQEDLLRLNIGGQLFTTTKTTLFSRGDNFFGPLVSGKINSLRDEHGAYYVDRNGKNFAPLLDYLRHGELIVPKKLKIASIFAEAAFYSINIVPGLCGRIKEGLYTSSHWIIFLERDQHHPWIFGVTGIEDGSSKESKNVFFKQVAKVKDSAIHWKYKALTYKIFVSKEDKVFLWNPNKYDSYTQLYFRCPSSTQFPLDIFETLTAERGKGETLTISFKANANKEVFAKTTFSSSWLVNNALNNAQAVPNPTPTVTSANSSTSLSAFVSTVEVLCRRLLIIHSSEKEEDTRQQQWILYIHSELAFFAFGNSNLDFGASLKKPMALSGKI